MFWAWRVTNAAAHAGAWRARKIGCSVTRSFRHRNHPRRRIFRKPLVTPLPPADCLKSSTQVRAGLQDRICEARATSFIWCTGLPGCRSKGQNAVGRRGHPHLNGTVAVVTVQARLGSSERPVPFLFYFYFWQHQQRQGSNNAECRALNHGRKLDELLRSEFSSHCGSGARSLVRRT